MTYGAGLSAPATTQASTTMRIGEVAARTGLTARAIRYYEEVGLLPLDPDRGKGKHRHYDEADVDQLQLIHSLCRLLGTPLDKVQRLVRPELAQVASERHWEGMETLVQRLSVVETALATVRGLLEVVGARRTELLEFEAALERRLAVIESRPVIGVPRNEARVSHGVREDLSSSSGSSEPRVTQTSRSLYPSGI